MPVEYVLLIAAVTAVSTYLLNRPKVNADAITALHATIASMSLRLDGMSKTVSEVTRDNGLQAVSIERQAFNLERVQATLTESQSLVNKQAAVIDGIPAFFDSMKKALTDAGIPIPVNLAATDALDALAADKTKE